MALHDGDLIVLDESNLEPEDDWIGQVIENRYRIVERIGHGGMGAVYKVVHTQMGKIAAMKLLHRNLVGDPELLRRFHREAKAISLLNHPNIIQVFDYGRFEDTAYLVMEYLKGEDLGLILKRDGPQNFMRIGVILAQICDALTEAHEMKIIHRDLKPENVRIRRTKDGQDFIKVLDFGLAKMLEDDKEMSITAKGNLVGTPYYMAPEMIRGETLDPRCDLYSLGAMAYLMLTGQHAFTAKTPVGVLTKHITDELTLPSVRAPENAIPPELDQFVAKAMAKDREARFQSAQEVKKALMEVMEVILQSSSLTGFRPFDSSPSVISSMQIESSQLNDAQRAELELSPTGRFEESPRSVSPILAKEDLEFETTIKRGRMLKLLMMIPLAVALGLGLWYGLRDGAIYAPTKEIEPNNEPKSATPLFRDSSINGLIGRRVSSKESDRDWYRFEIKDQGPQQLRAKLTGVANMDTTLELFDAMAGRITGADSAGKDGGETITNWTLDPGQYFLMVREMWQVDVPPTENVTDPYHLKINWRPFEQGWEMEPNDQPSHASPLGANEKLRGYLGAVNDVDHFKIRSAVGTLSGMVSGIKGVDLVLEITAAPGATKQLFDEESTSSGERFGGIHTDGREPVVLAIRRKASGKPPQGQLVQGLDTPYTVEVWVKPGQ